MLFRRVGEIVLAMDGDQNRPPWRFGIRDAEWPARVKTAYVGRGRIWITAPPSVCPTNLVAHGGNAPSPGQVRCVSKLFCGNWADRHAAWAIDARIDLSR